MKVGDGFQPKYQRLPDPQSPAGGVSSSVNDLARWVAMVLQNGKFEGRQIIPADALQNYLRAISPAALATVREGDLTRPRETRRAFD